MTNEFIPAACDKCSDTGSINNKPCPYCNPKTDNELIAEFMGDEKIHPRKRDYENSWDWLMPVVEKIEKTNHSNGRFYVQISSDWIYIAKFNDYSGLICKELITLQSNKLLSTYRAVVKFIEFYNLLK